MLIKPLFASLLLVLSVGAVCAQTTSSTSSPILGDWTGGLKVPNGQPLPLVFHFASTNGTVSASLDSPAQNSFGIQADAPPAVNDGIVSAQFSSVHGAFKGTLSTDHKTIVGTWSQGAFLPITLTRVPSIKAPNALTGTWYGLLSTPKGALHLNLVFLLHSDGTTSVAVQSPDQTAGSFPATSLTFVNNLLTAGFDIFGASYTGSLTADGTTLKGQWTQGGGSIPLNLTSKQP